jgi:hypothetical protein
MLLHLKNISLKTQLSVEHPNLESELNLMEGFVSFQEDHFDIEVKYSCDELVSVSSALLSENLCLINLCYKLCYKT